VKSSSAVRGFLIGYTSYEGPLTEDLVQETFLRAADCWDDLRERSSELRLAWLLTTAAHVAIDTFRRNETARKARPAVSGLQEREADSFRDALTAIALQRLERAIEAMPERRRLAALLRWRCGWKNAEIAEEMGITPGAVSQLLGAAKEVLRQELKGFIPFDIEESWDEDEGR
jgi:RNA polymerase sigma factor (sigma-70 family)